MNRPPTVDLAPQAWPAHGSEVTTMATIPAEKMGAWQWELNEVQLRRVCRKCNGAGMSCSACKDPPHGRPPANPGLQVQTFKLPEDQEAFDKTVAQWAQEARP